MDLVKILNNQFQRKKNNQNNNNNNNLKTILQLVIKIYQA